MLSSSSGGCIRDIGRGWESAGRSWKRWGRRTGGGGAGAGRESEVYLPLLPPMPLTQLHFSLSAALQCTVLHCTAQCRLDLSALQLWVLLWHYSGATLVLPA